MTTVHDHGLTITDTNISTSHQEGTLMRILALSLVCLLAFASTAHAHVDHFALIPNFREMYTDPSRVYVIEEGQERVLPDGEYDLIWIAGKCVAARDVNLSLHVTTIVITPTGHLDLGTLDDPIVGTITITFPDVPLHESDPGQWGNGLLVFGKLDICGRRKAGWMEVNHTMVEGQIPIVVNDGWQHGDQVFLPDTRPLTRAMESRVDKQYTLISTDPLTVYETITFPRFPLPDGSGGTMGPWVANATRNVVFYSENPEGVRGHILIADWADAEIRYASFLGLGRTTNRPLGPTNLIGRYALHFHHCWGNRGKQYQFIVEGCYANGLDEHILAADRAKWGFVVHQSHWGYLYDNCAQNFGGSGFVTEEGMETGTKFIHNLAFNCYGAELKGNDSITRGADGAGFWMKSIANYYEHNVSLNNRVGWQISVTRPDFGSKLVLDTLPKWYVPEGPGGSESLLIQPRMTTLSNKHNIIVCNDTTGYDSWGPQDTDKATILAGLPMIWEDCFLGYNSQLEMVSNTSSSSTLFQRCVFIATERQENRVHGIKAALSYRRNVFADECRFLNYGIAASTGMATIYRNCEFDADLGILANGSDSRGWAFGITLEDNTFSGEGIRWESTGTKFPVPEDPDSIKQCDLTLEQIYKNILVYRARLEKRL